MNLYSIQQKYRDLVAKIEQSEGELSPDLEAALIINDEDFKDKAAAYCVVIAEAELEANAIMEEAARLLKLKCEKMKTADRLRKALLTSMKDRGVQDIGFWKVRVATSKAVIVDDVAKVPTTLLRPPKPQEPEPDKAAIRKAIKSGQEVPGCRVVTNEYLLIR